MGVGDIIFWPVKSAFQALSVVMGVLLLFFVIWMILDCYNRKFKVEAEKWIWIVLILITNWVGALLYYVVIKRMNFKGVAKK